MGLLKQIHLFLLNLFRKIRDDQMKHSDHACPRRFPPDTYYIGQLKYIASLFPEKLIYAFIFTDDPQPDKIAAKYKDALNNPKIYFDYRKNQNS